jgi:hypothetical protein
MSSLQLFFFDSSCVDSQPGMIQLLIGVKSHVQVSRSTAASAEKELDSNAGVDLVSIF